MGDAISAYFNINFVGPGSLLVSCCGSSLPSWTLGPGGLAARLHPTRARQAFSGPLSQGKQEEIESADVSRGRGLSMGESRDQDLDPPLSSVPVLPRTPRHLSVPHVSCLARAGTTLTSLLPLFPQTLSSGQLNGVQ